FSEETHVVNGANIRRQYPTIDGAKLPRFESVKVLCIAGVVDSHCDYYSFQWELIFPNLEIVHFDGSNSGTCTKCRTVNANAAMDQPQLAENGDIRQSR